MHKIRAIGRPSKLTPEIEASIMRYLREGMFREVSARLSGISPSTFNKWLAENKEFSERVEGAENYSERGIARALLKHGKHSWQALAWFLERRNRTNYAQTNATLIQGNKDGFNIAVIQGGYRPDLQAAKETTERKAIEEASTRPIT